MEEFLMSPMQDFLKKHLKFLEFIKDAPEEFLKQSLKEIFE